MKLEEMREIERRATVAPWTARECGIINKYIDDDDDAVVVSGEECKHMRKENIQFIAMARDALPKLLKVAEEAKLMLSDIEYGCHGLSKALEELEK